MFGLGIWEIAAIVVVIVVFVKPSELPRAARTAGRVVRRAQTAIARAKTEMRQIGSALERTAAEPGADTPSDDAIHPMRPRPSADEPDADARPGYNGRTSSGDAAGPGTR